MRPMASLSLVPPPSPLSEPALTMDLLSELGDLLGELASDADDEWKVLVEAARRRREFRLVVGGKED